MKTETQFRLQLLPSKNAVARHHGGLHVAVRATPPRPEKTERRPVALALVIDRSGSMSEPAVPAYRGARAPSKLGFVRSAAECLLEVMQEGDAVALIVFDDHVRVIRPMTVLRAGNRRETIASVRDLQTGNCTYLEGGLRTGIDEFSPSIGNDYSCKLVLLSDGEANVGETQHNVLADRAATAAASRITISTLGVGVGYNSELMDAIATAGNGDFHHIEAPDALDRVLLEELAAAGEVPARSVEVELSVPNILAVSPNLNGYPQEETAAGVKVKLGDLVRQKDAFFELTSPVALEGDWLTLRANARYRKPGGAVEEASAECTVAVVTAEEAAVAGEDPEILRLVVALLRAQAGVYAAARYEAGDLVAAGQALSMTGEALDQLHRFYGAGALASAGFDDAKSYLARIESSFKGRSLSGVDLKRMYASAQSLRRSRSGKLLG